MNEPSNPSPVLEPVMPDAQTRRQKLIETLNTTVRPLARQLGFALGLGTGGNMEWFETHEQCSCTSPEAVSGSNQIHVPFGEGFILLCPGKQTVPEFSALQEVVRTICRDIEREAEQESLLGELSACWESLDTLYRLSADLREVHQTQELLNRILERAVAFHSGLKAILWIDSEAQLKATAVRNTEKPPARPAAGGLVGKTIQNRTTTVTSGRAHELPTRGTDPELAGAVSLVIAPVGTREAVIGALAIWHDSEPVRFDSSRIRLIESLALQAATIIESERFHHASLESARMRNELEIGSNIQRMLLLKEPPRDIAGVQLGVAMIPSRQVDGDFCEFVRHSENCLDLVVADVMGKGVPAALIGAATKIQITQSLSALLAAAKGGKIPTPAQVVNAVHKEISERLIELDRFVTLCYARLDLSEGKLDIVDCGHTRTIHVDGRTGSAWFISGDNLPLGVSKREVYEQMSVPLNEGDILFFYSDGITEARNPAGELFGEERLADNVKNCRNCQPDELIRNIRQCVTGFAQTDSFSDDLTCVAVRIAHEKAASLAVVTRLDLMSSLDQLTRMREWLRDVYARAAREDEDGFHLLELAATEAFTNVVRHAFREVPDNRIWIQAENLPGLAVLTISHFGESFDPGTAKPPSFDGSREGGFGLYIISQAVDEVTYSRNELGENIIRLVKRLRS